MLNRFTILRNVSFIFRAALVIAIMGITAYVVLPQIRVHAASDSDAMKTIVIPVEGMTCVSCVARVKRTLTAIDGVVEINVDLEKRQTRVRYIEGRVTPEQLTEAINNLGYRAGTLQRRSSNDIGRISPDILSEPTERIAMGNGHCLASRCSIQRHMSLYAADWSRSGRGSGRC